MFRTQPTPFFDDVHVGDEPPKAMIRLTPPIMVRWCAAIELWRRDHYDKDFAVGHVKQPDILGSGLWSRGMLYAYLSNWAGLDGWVWKQKHQNRAPLLPGDEFTIWSRVTNKEVIDGLGYVELDLGMRTLLPVSLLPRCGRKESKSHRLLRRSVPSGSYEALPRPYSMPATVATAPLLIADS
jgi:acyl dehydratase